jgi:hypothetical protein
MTTSRRHARSFRLGRNDYAFLDAAAVALLALLIGGFVLQILRGPGGSRRPPRDDMASTELARHPVPPENSTPPRARANPVAC